MKLLTICSVFMILLCYSCSKSTSTPAPQNPIVGLWVGSYTDVSYPDQTFYYSLDVRSDSSVIKQGLGSDGNTYYSVGSWSLSGTTFTATITTENLSQAGVIQDLTGTYSSSSGTLNGSISLPNGSPYESFTLMRVN